MPTEIGKETACRSTRVDLGSLVLDSNSTSFRHRGCAAVESALSFDVDWADDAATFEVRNVGSRPVRIDEIVLFEGDHWLSADTSIHAEGFTMLSQTVGTLGNPIPLSEYTDRDHYRLPERDGWLTAYNMIFLAPRGQLPILLGFASSHRFQGAIRFSASRYEVVLDTEGLALPPGGRWALEEFVALRGRSRHKLHLRFADKLRRRHPATLAGTSVGIIRGWSSWVAHGVDVTARHMRTALAVLKAADRAGDVVQLDDGYQSRMGDWFAPNAAFGAGLEDVARDIREAGFVPGVWLAPFVADEDSNLFIEHADWFVKDNTGKPLRSDRIGFGGWGVNGPWYGLDGSHPEARAFLTAVFQRLSGMGFRHFKLDALYWGCLKGANFHADHVTRVESFRLGMAAIREGLAADAFVTAANHPVWPCLGLIDASRTSMDIFPTWESVRSTSLQNRLRSWQHGRLWSVDPDTVLLDNRGGSHAFAGSLSMGELSYHHASVFAGGGLVFSGDRLTDLPPDALSRLDELPGSPRTCYHDDGLNLATVEHSGGKHLVILNPDDTRAAAALPDVTLDKDIEATLGRCNIRLGKVPMVELEPRSGVVLPCE